MTAYHIQDLRLLLPALDFELRVNEHYAKTNPSFREWLRELLRGGLASERTEELSNHRFDLLCSLCFPTIDPPQLLRVSKLCALTFLVNDGLVQEEAQSSQWLDPLPNLDQLLRAADSMRAKQVQELQCSPHTTLGANVLRFASNLFSLFNPPREANTRSSHPGLPEFLITLENAYDCKFSGELTNVTVLEALWRCTTNITMWSQDLASYSSRHPTKCDRCTVCYSLKVQGFTLQAAVDDIRRSLQSEVGKFVGDYRSLTARACDNEGVLTVAAAMLDCITGFVHWIYEGERYFGKHYEEVARFGWVFMDTGGTSVVGDDVDVS